MNANDQLIRDSEAAGMLGCSKATFWRRVADGTIPKPVKIGGMSRWPRSEITEVIESAKARRATCAMPNAPENQRPVSKSANDFGKAGG